MRLRNATDLRLNLDDLVQPTIHGGLMVLMGLGDPWSMAAEAMARVGHSPCPICAGRPLRKSRYCLSCDRAGLDGLVNYPGLDMDEVRDPEWSAEPTVYIASESLEGGVGPRRAKFGRGIGRARNAG